MKQKQEQEQRLLEKRKVDAILNKIKVGQRIFCTSIKPIYAGVLLSEVEFYCKDTGVTHVTFDSLDDWDIVSEVRTPEVDRQSNAVLYRVSLALKKTKH